MWLNDVLGKIAFVTKRRTGGNTCSTTNSSGKPQKTLSKTDSRPTNADQQHRRKSTLGKPKAAGDGRNHQTRTGAEETKQQHPTALTKAGYDSYSRKIVHGMGDVCMPHFRTRILETISRGRRPFRLARSSFAASMQMAARPSLYI